MEENHHLCGTYEVLDVLSDIPRGISCALHFGVPKRLIKASLSNPYTPTLQRRQS